MMIKKLTVAATFAASMMIGVPTASANSPFLCMQEYQAAMGNCGEDSQCARYANIAFNQCLQKLALEES